MLSGFLVDDRTNLAEENRHVDLNHLPQSLVLQTEVVVRHQITSTGDLPPLHRRVAVANILGDILDGFPNHLEKPHQGVLRHVLFCKVLERQLVGVIDDLLSRILNVVEEKNVVTRHGLPRARCWA